MLDLNGLKKAVKTGQTWRSEDGVIYTVVSNKVESKKHGVSNPFGNGGSWKEINLNVMAYTLDLSIDFSNGTVGGKQCHWVNMWTSEFVEKFVKA